MRSTRLSWALPPVDTPAPAVYLHAYLGELAHRLPTLPPVDNQPWMRTYTWASWRKLTSVAPCRQVALDMYLDTCFGKLARSLPALRPIDNRLRLPRCRASWRSTNRRCLLLPTWDVHRFCIPSAHHTSAARILKRAGTAPTGVTSSTGEIKAEVCGLAPRLCSRRVAVARANRTHARTRSQD